MRVLPILIKLIFHHLVLIAWVSCNQCSRGLLSVKLRGLMVGRLKGLNLWSTKVEICAFRHVAVELEPEKDTCPSVHRSSDTSRHWILPKLGMMLEDNKCRKVTRPFFPGKINLINYSWKSFFAIFWRLGPQMDLILHILIVLNGLHDLVLVPLVFCIIKGH